MRQYIIYNIHTVRISDIQNDGCQDIKTYTCIYAAVAIRSSATVYPKKYAHGFCFAVLCCGYALTNFPISIRLTSLALWQSNDCPSASKAALMNMNTSCEFIMNDCITTTKQSTTQPCAYILGYTVWDVLLELTVGYQFPNYAHVQF